jgi:glycerol-3-phosphate O-acyltransferase
MGALFAEGGNVFWVAPSGGRDRPDATGEFAVASFDAKTLDMFRILAMQSQKVSVF